jgi:hypothetical protein
MHNVALAYQVIGLLVGLFYLISGLASVQSIGFGGLLEGLLNAVVYGGLLAGVGFVLQALDINRQNSSQTLDILQRITKRRQQ